MLKQLNFSINGTQLRMQIIQQASVPTQKENFFEAEDTIYV